jgi:hypothetical protein
MTVKIYRNPDRNKPDSIKTHTPQYIAHDIEPVAIKATRVSNAIAISRPQPLPLDNPRAKRPLVRQPYATPMSSPVGGGGLPNVGNNVEQTWVAVDGDMIDDFTGDQPMIDNNDEVTDQALGFQNGSEAVNLQPILPQGQVVIQHAPVSSGDDLLPVISDLQENSFLLIVQGIPLCSGPQIEIEEQARDLVFGEHEMCEGVPIPVEDVIVLKRIKIKVGLYLD